MTPEGRQSIIEALEDEKRHGDYEVLPEPAEGEDVEYVTIRRLHTGSEIIPGLVMQALGRFGLSEATNDTSEGVRLKPIKYQAASMTFRDLNSQNIYSKQ